MFFLYFSFSLFSSLCDFQLRCSLDVVLSQLRLLLQKRSGESDFYQIWSTVDFVVLNGLIRIEQFLTDLDQTQQTQNTETITEQTQKQNTKHKT